MVVPNKTDNEVQFLKIAIYKRTVRGDFIVTCNVYKWKSSVQIALNIYDLLQFVIKSQMVIINYS